MYHDYVFLYCSPSHFVLCSGSGTTKKRFPEFWPRQPRPADGDTVLGYPLPFFEPLFFLCFCVALLSIALVVSDLALFDRTSPSFSPSFRQFPLALPSFSLSCCATSFNFLRCYLPSISFSATFSLSLSLSLSLLSLFEMSGAAGGAGAAPQCAMKSCVGALGCAGAAGNRDGARRPPRASCVGAAGWARAVGAQRERKHAVPVNGFCADPLLQQDAQGNTDPAIVMPAFGRKHFSLSLCHSQCGHLGAMWPGSPHS